MVKPKALLLEEDEMQQVHTLLKEGFLSKGTAFHYNHSNMRTLGTSEEIVFHENLVQETQ